MGCTGWSRLGSLRAWAVQLPKADPLEAPELCRQSTVQGQGSVTSPCHITRDVNSTTALRPALLREALGGTSMHVWVERQNSKSNRKVFTKTYQYMCFPKTEVSFTITAA